MSQQQLPEVKANYTTFNGFCVALGINPETECGCVMLDVENIDTKDLIPTSLLYTSPHPDRIYINGRPRQSHISLKYGILRSDLFPSVTMYEDEVRRLLSNWEKPSTVTIESIENFGSAYPDEQYHCLVAKIHIDSSLKEANNKLSWLPHLDKFNDYKPHITLAYIQPVSPAILGELMTMLNDTLKGKKINVKTLNISLK